MELGTSRKYGAFQGSQGIENGLMGESKGVGKKVIDFGIAVSLILWTTAMG